MKFLMNISFIVFILHISLFRQQVKCSPHKSPKQFFNFTPTNDDCPENTLCENPPGYPKEFIRRALLRNKGIEIRPAHAVSTHYSPEAAYAPPPANAVESNHRSVLRPTGFHTIPRLGGDLNIPRRKVVVYSDEMIPKDPSTSSTSASVSGYKTIEHYHPPRSNITDYDHNLRTLSVNRVRTESEKPDLCPSLIKTMRPKTGTSVQNEKLFIVNEEEILIQEIDVEICGDTIEDAECRFIEPLEIFKAVCKQKHLRKELVVLRPNGELESVAMKIPSHCCCDIVES